jgi:hypothetical protein
MLLAVGKNGYGGTMGPEGLSVAEQFLPLATGTENGDLRIACQSRSVTAPHRFESSPFANISPPHATAQAQNESSPSRCWQPTTNSSMAAPLP